MQQTTVQITKFFTI